MTACTACGFDQAATVTARWSFFVPLDSKSMNDRLSNAGSSRWAYKADRNRWIKAICLSTSLALRSAEKFRRVTITRCYFGRQQLREYDNLVGGMKGVDALVTTGVLVDDSAKFAQIIYKQERCSPIGLQFEVEELSC